jgi:hypothetical protein
MIKEVFWRRKMVDSMIKGVIERSKMVESDD